jgi:hypothetical protein
LATNWRWDWKAASSLARNPVEGLPELLELVLGAVERKPPVQVGGGDVAGGRRDRAQGTQDASGDDPAERDRRQCHGGQRGARLDEELVQGARRAVRVPGASNCRACASSCRGVRPSAPFPWARNCGSGPAPWGAWLGDLTMEPLASFSP